MKLEKYCPLVSIYSNKMLQILFRVLEGKVSQMNVIYKIYFVKAYKPIINNLLYYSIFSHSIYQLLHYSKLFPIF